MILGLFESRLTSQDPPTVLMLYLFAAIRQISESFRLSAEAEGRPELYSKMPADLYNSLLELCLSWLFGFLMARIRRNLETGSVSRFILASENFYEFIPASLSLPDSTPGGPHATIGAKANLLALSILEGDEFMCRAGYKINLSDCLFRAGFSQATIDRLMNTYLTDIDATVDEMLSMSNDLWQTIPRRARSVVVEEHASVAMSVVQTINKHPRYTALFTSG